MAQLKDTLVAGSLRVTDTIYTTKLQTGMIYVPTTSTGTTYGPGEENEVLVSNGSSVYWGEVTKLKAIDNSGAAAVSSTNRPTSANLDYKDGSVRYFLATSAMGESTKPTMGDSHILHLAWDNTAWAAQLAIEHLKSGTSYVHAQIRGQGSTAANWSNWFYLLDENNYTDYTVTKTGTGASGNWGINITGNADTATSATKDSSGNVISDTYLKLSGGTMTNGITFGGTDSSAWNTKGVLFSKGSRIGEDTSGVLGVYGKKIVIRPDSLTQNSSDGIEITGSGLYPSNNNSEELGSSSKKWSNVYATTFVGDLNGSAKKLAQVDDITSLNDFIDSTYLIYAAEGGTNTVTNKPSGVDAFGVLSFKTAQSWQGQLLISSNQNSGIYWRTGVATSNTISTDWLKVLDSNNYTDYTVTKTGTGASGTWGISITGNAANVTGTVTVDHGGTGATSFTSGALLIGNGTEAIGTRAIKDIRSAGNLGWTDKNTDIDIPTINTLAYWNGRYNSSNSNLTYCIKGAFGDAVIKGVVTTLDTSANLPTAGAVSTAISNALGDYVTLATQQTVSGRKTFQNLATTTFKGSTGSEYCNINYNQTLGALVFSFG